MPGPPAEERQHIDSCSMDYSCNAADDRKCFRVWGRHHTWCLQKIRGLAKIHSHHKQINTRTHTNSFVSMEVQERAMNQMIKSIICMTYRVKWIALIDRHLEVCLKLIKGCYLKTQRKKGNTIIIIRLDTWICSVCKDIRSFYYFDLSSIFQHLIGIAEVELGDTTEICCVLLLIILYILNSFIYCRMRYIKDHMQYT